MKNYSEVVISITYLAEDAIRTSGDNMVSDIWQENA